MNTSIEIVKHNGKFSGSIWKGNKEVYCGVCQSMWYDEHNDCYNFLRLLAKGMDVASNIESKSANNLVKAYRFGPAEVKVFANKNVRVISKDSSLYRFREIDKSILEDIQKGLYDKVAVDIKSISFSDHAFTGSEFL